MVKAHDVNVCARVRNGQILSVVRKAQSVDRMTFRDVRNPEITLWEEDLLATGDGSCAYPFCNIEQIHDGIVSTGRDVLSPGILSYCNATSDVSSWVLLYRQSGVLENP